jgi:hypothetical protein
MTNLEKSDDQGKSWAPFDPAQGKPEDGLWLRFPAESGMLETIYSCILTGETRIPKIAEAVGLPEWVLEGFLLSDEGVTGDYARLQDAFVYSRGIQEYLKANDVVLDLTEGHPT